MGPGIFTPPNNWALDFHIPSPPQHIGPGISPTTPIHVPQNLPLLLQHDPINSHPPPPHNPWTLKFLPHHLSPTITLHPTHDGPMNLPTPIQFVSEISPSPLHNGSRIFPSTQVHRDMPPPFHNHHHSPPTPPPIVYMGHGILQPPLKLCPQDPPPHPPTHGLWDLSPPPPKYGPWGNSQPL